MKIYSWNVYCFNKEMWKVSHHIRELDFDVLCLQEVTPALLHELKSMPFHLTYHVDVLRLFSKGKHEYNYVAILSKAPFLNTGTLQFIDFPFPVHTRLFITFMSMFRWSFVTERGAVYADIQIGERIIRFFSVHLTLWGPGNRQREFEAVAGHLEPGAPSVVCGDFNVIEYPPLKVLNWLLGSPLAEALPWYPERDIFEERFKTLGLKNPLRGMTTHPFSRSQLDHILVSENIVVTSAKVELERHGSDHALVGVQID